MPVRKYRADDPARPIQFSFLCALEDPLEFVIHEHWATSHHYDLRLQAGKTLLSWVLTSTPSLNPNCSSRAIAVDDHPLKCLDGEGRITEGSYGAGPMIMWDRGTYRPVASQGVSREFALIEGVRSGRMELMFEGFKMHGRWELYRRGERWRFKKLLDEHASLEARFCQRSVLSGLLISDF